MAILPLPPSGVAFIDPITGGVSVQWQNYLLSLSTIGGGFAPLNAEYWVSTANSDLTNETNLGALTSGYMKLTVAAAVGTPSTVTSIPGGDVTGAALTKTDDTNVTLTLGGTPTTALLHAVSLTLGWTGTLAFARIVNIATASILGRNTAGTGVIEVLSALPNAIQDAITRLGTIATGVWQATKIGLVYGGTNADLSGTGGTSQVLKQISSGAAVTVGQLAVTDLTNFVAWTDYGSTSTIVGWASFTVKNIYYTRLGSMVWVAFDLEGTSNSTSVTFTLPIASAAGNPASFAFIPDGVDNGLGLTTTPAGFLPASSSTVTVFASLNAAGWTATGTKKVLGQFFYQV